MGIESDIALFFEDALQLRTSDRQVIRIGEYHVCHYHDDPFGSSCGIIEIGFSEEGPIDMEDLRVTTGVRASRYAYMMFSIDLYPHGIEVTNFHRYACRAASQTLQVVESAFAQISSAMSLPVSMGIVMDRGKEDIRDWAIRNDYVRTGPGTYSKCIESIIVE